MGVGPSGGGWSIGAWGVGFWGMVVVGVGDVPNGAVGAVFGGWE